MKKNYNEEDVSSEAEIIKKDDFDVMSREKAHAAKIAEGGK